jgi:hypothetical protein
VRRRIANRDAATVRFAAIAGAVHAQPFGWTRVPAVSHA